MPGPGKSDDETENEELDAVVPGIADDEDDALETDDLAASDEDDEDLDSVPATATGKASAERLLELFLEKKALVLHAKKPGKGLIEGVVLVVRDAWHHGVEILVLRLVVALARSRHDSPSSPERTRSAGGGTTHAMTRPALFGFELSFVCEISDFRPQMRPQATRSIRRMPLRVTTMRTRCQGVSSSSSRRSR